MCRTGPVAEQDEVVVEPAVRRSAQRLPVGAQQHLADRRRVGDDPPVGVREPVAQGDEQLRRVAADVGGAGRAPG
ncbi:hypothetical protein ASD08_09395 [Streptomyces sp. Root369]|nr:hypothetical protein [Streptomyces sp. Root369]KQW02062.1 hypothetical protein ASD08_09395 [Streptomyces sp. Root369]